MFNPIYFLSACILMWMYVSGCVMHGQVLCFIWSQLGCILHNSVFPRRNFKLKKRQRWTSHRVRVGRGSTARITDGVTQFRPQGRCLNKNTEWGWKIISQALTWVRSCLKSSRRGPKLHQQNKNHKTDAGTVQYAAQYLITLTWLRMRQSLQLSLGQLEDCHMC